MSGTINKVILVGNLGGDPEIRSMQNGNKVCNFSLATSENWRDKSTGEKRERTEWHRIVIFSEGLCSIAEKYFKKGSKIYLEGQIQTRKWEKDGRDHYYTEVVLQGFGGTLMMLDGKKSSPETGNSPFGESAPPSEIIEDEIPFSPERRV